MLRALSIDHKTSLAVISLILAMKMEIIPNKIGIKTLLHSIGKETFERLLAIRKVIDASDDMRQKKLCDAEALYHVILKDNECYSLRQLTINGADLMELGILNGKQIGNMLSALLQMVIEEKVENDKTALVEAVKTYIKP